VRRLPWLLAALALALLISAVALTGLDEIGQDAIGSSLALAFTGVGALIASRQPANAMGWLLLGIGVATGLGFLAGSYADYWVAGGWGSQRLGETAAWYGNLSWIPFILVPCTFVPLLFPDGHLLSRRWRWAAWCAGAGIVSVFVTGAIQPGPIDDFPQIENPYGVGGALVETLYGFAFLVVLVAIVASCASLVARFRREQGERRQQIKWLALAGVAAGVVVPLATIGTGLWGQAVTNFASMLSVVCLPLAVGLAILRHRLYDIDLVIRRTLVYGALTATLGGTYLGLVVLAGVAVGRSSDLAIAASTLAVAALFRPARRRIQGLVDRRFFRRRYDATQTLEAFAGRLRDEVDLEALRADLRGVVSETVQPAHATLWLRGAGEPSWLRSPR
jgi:hypothetical protein